MKPGNLAVRLTVLSVIVFYTVTNLGAHPPRLIVRSDDMGAFHAINEACLEVCNNGICTTVEVMPVCAWFPEAVKMLRENPKIEVGIHLVLTSEWENVKWRPLTYCPSLTDENGYFLPMLKPDDVYPSLSLRDCSPEEVERELRTQIEVVLANLPQANHVTGHMGIMQHPAFAEISQRLAREYGLMHLESREMMDAHQISYAWFGGEHATTQQKFDSFIKTLDGLEDDRTYMFIEHPAVESDELNTVFHIGYENVMEDRIGVTELFTSPAIKEKIAERGIELTDYAGVMRRLPRTDPQSAGIPQEAIDNVIQAMQGSGVDLHSFMLLKKGEVVYEEWFGEHGPRVPHQMNSVSKTVTSCAIGIAIEEGLLELDDKVVSFFPDKLPANVSSNLAQLSIRHLLTMSVGHDVARANDIRATDNDWVESFLSLPVDTEPGTVFDYNSMATYMLSAILQEVTGQKMLDYLYPRMLLPLGITGIYSLESPQGIQTGGWGIFLKTEDMAKIGQLLLNKGEWNGQGILTAEWVQMASSAQIDNCPAGVERDPANDWHQGYGFQLWKCHPSGVFRADGANGQFIIVMPEQQAVIAITAHENNMQMMLDHIWEHLLPVL